MKIIKSFLIVSLLTLGLLEITAFIYFNFISNDKENLNIYINKRAATDKYKFFDEIGLVLPSPNLKIYHHTEEFLDIFETKDILNKGIGFFDDGIDEKKIKAVAIGDSFTRGVGSIDNLKNGWVELVEKYHGEIDLINLGNLGIGINDQKYGYDKLAKIIDHELIIYNFFAGGDYIDNINDKVNSLFIEKKSKILSPFEIQLMVKDFNKRHGYKHYMEYLMNSNGKYRFYSYYFILKIFDYLNIKKVINTYKFDYELPGSEARLNVVDDELYSYHKSLIKKIRCINEKYCVKENDIFENQEVLKKIIKNSSDKINEFYKESIANGKKFILVIHPSSRNFYPKKTNVNYNDLDNEMIKILNKDIPIIDLKKYLREVEKDNPEQSIFYKFDGHYTTQGYDIVSKIISKNLKHFLN